MNDINKTVFHKCNYSNCNNTFEVPMQSSDDTHLNKIEDTFTYVKCPECKRINQINFYNISTIDTHLVKKLPLAIPIGVKSIEINPANIHLTTNLGNFSKHLNYLEEIYDLGDLYSFIDLLEEYNLVDVEENNGNITKTYMVEDTTQNIHLGYMGTEIYSKDPSRVWISWTLILDNFRDRGIGTIAIQRLLNWLRHEGITTVMVDCDVYNPRTINWYKKMKFTEVSTCKEFRKKHKEYNKSFFSYDKDIVMKLEL